MPHGSRLVRFVVERLCRERDRRSRHELANERHAAANFAGDGSPNVEPQIDFLEVLVERNEKTHDARATKQESHDAEVRHAAEHVQVDSGGNERLEQRRADAIVEHREVSPLGAQKGSRHARDA